MAKDGRVKGFDTVLVLDFGAQYGQLIARRVRECRVYSELIPYDAPIERIKGFHPKGIILSGGPMSVYVEDAPKVDPEIFKLGVPVLGICYGAQAIALELGGTVTRTGLSEFGKTALTVLKPGQLLKGLRGEEQCWMSHRDSITEPPPGFEVLAASGGAPVAAMEDRERGFFGSTVPSRGRAHAQGHGRAAQLPLQGLRLRAHVHAGLDHRGIDQEDP